MEPKFNPEPKSSSSHTFDVNSDQFFLHADQTKLGKLHHPETWGGAPGGGKIFDSRYTCIYAHVVSD